MGLDVLAYAEGDITDGQLYEANKYMMARGVSGWERDEPPLVRDPYFTDRVNWRTMERYYGTGYERGHWPKIANALACMRAALPHCAVFYGSDSDDYGDPVDDEFFAGMWEHWLSDKGQAYHERRADE